MAGAVSAQEYKVGYINTQRITTESTPAKMAQSKLEQEFSKRQKELTDQQSSLKAFSDKFERDAPTLSESQRAARQKEYSEIGRDFQRKQREFQEDLNGRRNEAVVLGDGGKRHQSTLKALIDAGANLKLTDRHGQTPLQLAKARGYSEMVNMLEKAEKK